MPYWRSQRLGCKLEKTHAYSHIVSRAFLLGVLPIFWGGCNVETPIIAIVIPPTVVQCTRKEKLAEFLHLRGG